MKRTLVLAAAGLGMVTGSPAALLLEPTAEVAPAVGWGSIHHAEGALGPLLVSCQFSFRAVTPPGEASSWRERAALSDGEGEVSSRREGDAPAMAGETPALPAEAPQSSKRAALSDNEEDKLREEQDPAKRIELYLAFSQDRLSQFEIFRQKPDDPQYNTGKYLDQMLGQYIALDDELKDWIDYQYDRGGDMRAGLAKLVQVGAQQLEQLRHIQQASDPRSAAYGHSVQDAIDDLTDTIDGGTKALAEQIKKFGELKKEKEAAARAEKERTKEAEKREKEEKKLQKKERKQNKVPADADQEN